MSCKPLAHPSNSTYGALHLVTACWRQGEILMQQTLFSLSVLTIDSFSQEEDFLSTVGKYLQNWEVFMLPLLFWEGSVRLGVSRMDIHSAFWPQYFSDDFLVLVWEFLVRPCSPTDFWWTNSTPATTVHRKWPASTNGMNSIGLLLLLLCNIKTAMSLNWTLNLTGTHRFSNMKGKPVAPRERVLW